jgi:hypothetical protein
MIFLFTKNEQVKTQWKNIENISRNLNLNEEDKNQRIKNRIGLS